MKILLILLLSLTACDVVVTAKNIADAERMCERQKGVEWAKREPYWLTVKCNNGMTFKQSLYTRK